ncbi:glycosyltransferase family 2 protein [Lactococcus protaetiae]|uniref:Glycosyltransferase family 2 protein n=1 Tax=Lactococcus protaetiae TaxID=2592653 RepID=A0A514Z8L9_9LACT|nr:glycosyltransferase family 2 protein [Lactococcus protaetiae]QDK70935.1 glycosyltransferase family 2 protein [Lactococcus protaetiae]
MSNPLISVIIPCYNIADYVMECVLSVINQTYKNIEIILVDDGSTDDTLKNLEVLKTLDNRIRILQKENGGLSDARNEGIKFSTGDYITLIDGDDSVSENYVKHLYQGILKGADISCVSWYLTYENEKIDFKEISSAKDDIIILSKREGLKQVFNQGNFETTACAKLYPRIYFNKIKFPKGLSFEDLATVPLLLEQANKISFCNVRDYYYYQRDNSLLHEDFNQRKMDVLIVGERLISEFLPKNFEIQSIFYGRIFAAYSTIYRQIPDKTDKYQEERERLWNGMKNVRKKLKIFEIENSKVKLGVISSYFGQPVFRYIFNIYSQRIVKRN